jgi:hypothetical protein
MAAGNKGFLTVFLSCLVVLTAFGAAAAWSVHSAGMFELDVHVKGPGGVDISGIRVPAVLGHLALAFLPTRVFDFCDDEDFLRNGPLVQEALRQLDDAPDFVLVEVLAADEHVLVRKEGNALVVDVRSEDEDVHVSVPLRIARAFARKIERASRSYS